MGEIKTLFSPGVSVTESVQREMESTPSTLEMAIHEITSLDIAQALVKIKQKVSK